MVFFIFLKGTKFNSLCKYLGIPNGLMGVLDLNSNITNRIIKSWCSESNINSVKTSIDYPIPVNKLVELPHDFIDLLSSSSQM
jgi:hypothetical protein